MDAAAAVSARAKSVGLLAVALAVTLAGAVLMETPVVVAERAQIEAQVLAATPHLAGRLARLEVEEGDRVRQGQVVARLEAGDLIDEVERAEAALAVAVAGLPASRQAAALLDVQRSAATDQAAAALAAAKADLAAERARSAQAESMAAARRAGRARGVVSEQELVAAEADARAAKALVEAAVGRVKAAEAALALARRQAGMGSVEQAGIARGEAEVQAAKAALTIARRRREHSEIVAPADGIVARRLLSAGDQVMPGQPVFTVLADGPVWVRAEVRETDAPAVQLGAGATVTVDALPGKEWFGRVSRVGVVTEPRDALVGRLIPTVAVTVVLDSPDTGLMPGMTARVRIEKAGGRWFGRAAADSQAAAP